MRFLGAIAGLFMSIFGRRRLPVTGEDQARAEFPTSTQKMGVRFTKKIRDVFRFRWIRPADRPEDDDSSDDQHPDR